MPRGFNYHKHSNANKNIWVYALCSCICAKICSLHLKKKLLFWPVFLKGKEPPHVTLNRDDRRHIPVSHGLVLQDKAFCKSFPLYYHINVWVKAVLWKQTVPYWIFFIMTVIQMCGQKHENSKKGGNHLQHGLFNVICMFDVKLLQS